MSKNGLYLKQVENNVYPNV